MVKHDKLDDITYFVFKKRLSWFDFIMIILFSQILMRIINHINLSWH